MSLLNSVSKIRKDLQRGRKVKSNDLRNSDLHFDQNPSKVVQGSKETVVMGERRTRAINWTMEGGMQTNAKLGNKL